MSFRHVLAVALLLAFATAQAETAAPVVGDAKAGATKAAVCGACHGMDGNSADKMYPKLAGQNQAYIARQLALFKSGKRMAPLMMPFAAQLSDQDMHDLGAFFATQKSLPGVADEQFVARAQELYRGGDAKLGVPACMACHGPDGRGMAGVGYPQLAGQWSEYISLKLGEWKAGTHWADDVNGKVMPQIVAKLSDADIAALSSYVSGLHAASGGGEGK